MEDGVVVVVSRCQSRKIVARLWGMIRVELDNDGAHGRLEHNRHGCGARGLKKVMACDGDFACACAYAAGCCWYTVIAGEMEAFPS